MKNSQLLIRTLLISSIAIPLIAIAALINYADHDTIMPEQSMHEAATKKTDGAIVKKSIVEIDGKKIMMPASVIKNAKEKLSNKGYRITKINGVMDNETKDALKKFQKKEKLRVTSMLNQETLEKLDVNYKDAMNTRRNKAEFSE